MDSTLVIVSSVIGFFIGSALNALILKSIMGNANQEMQKKMLAKIDLSNKLLRILCENLAKEELAKAIEKEADLKNQKTAK